MSQTVPTLEGATIRLVPMSRDHLADLCAVGLDPALWQATTIAVSSAADMATYIISALDAGKIGTALPFVIAERGTGTIVGTTRIHSIVPEHRRAEIGFTWIARPWQRTKVNTEAKYLLLKHAFEAMRCVRVEFKTDSENEPSRRALLRIGAREEGTLRNYRVSAHRGIRHLSIYSIIESEWPTVRSNLEAKLNAAASSV
jgi:N-acetyltransferase